MAAFLEIKNLRKDVVCPDQSTLTILRVPALSVSKGEQLLLTGPSGTGKTTLLHLVSGLMVPTEGEIHCDGLRVDTLSATAKDQWRADHIGYIFQKLNLLESLTVLENVMLGGFFSQRVHKEQLKQAAMQLLERVGLSDKAQIKPAHLSLGEQQRVSVVRALMKQPQLILADEPTASLDQKNAKIVLALLQKLCEDHQTTLLLSTHDTNIMKMFAARYDLQLGRQVS